MASSSIKPRPRSSREWMLLTAFKDEMRYIETLPVTIAERDEFMAKAGAAWQYLEMRVKEIETQTK